MEGLADFFAAALSGDPLIAEYASGEIAGGVGTRSLESGARCPESITGDPHGDGQLTSSGALFRNRVVLLVQLTARP